MGKSQMSQKPKQHIYFSCSHFFFSIYLKCGKSPTLCYESRNKVVANFLSSIRVLVSCYFFVCVNCTDWFFFSLPHTLNKRIEIFCSYQSFVYSHCFWKSIKSFSIFIFSSSRLKSLWPSSLNSKVFHRKTEREREKMLFCSRLSVHWF